MLQAFVFSAHVAYTVRFNLLRSFLSAALFQDFSFQVIMPRNFVKIMLQVTFSPYSF